MTLTQLKERLESLPGPKELPPITILPASNVRLNDLYPLFTVLSDAGLKKAFVKIFRKDGTKIRSKEFGIDFKDWSTSPEGTVYWEEPKDFFKELK